MTTKQTLDQRAMLISLSIPYWTGKAGDERMTDVIVQSQKAERDAIETKKLLIAPAALNAVKAVRSRARSYLFETTSPWLDGGTRVLASGFYFDGMEKLREFHTEYEQAVAQLIRDYPKLKGEARKRLGALYKDEDYPSAEMLKSKFGWDLKVFPIPAAGDWRVDLGVKDNAAMQKKIDEQVKQACAVITRDLWTRLMDPVSKMAEKMKDGDATFRDSIITNIKDIVALIPTMNVADDPKLNEMAKKIEQSLTKFVPDEVREDGKLRKKAADAADEILAKLAGYVGGK
jgi:hypothetical protein